jgi:hypothetical protein
MSRHRTCLGTLWQLCFSWGFRSKPGNVRTFCCRVAQRAPVNSKMTSIDGLLFDCCAMCLVLSIVKRGNFSTRAKSNWVRPSSRSGQSARLSCRRSLSQSRRQQRRRQRVAQQAQQTRHTGRLARRVQQQQQPDMVGMHHSRRPLHGSSQWRRRRSRGRRS